MTVATVRYFQRQGLLEHLPIRLAGRRCYSQQHVYRVQFIKRAQALGFSLEEIAEHLAAESSQWHGEIRELAAKKTAMAPNRSDETPESSKKTQ